MSGWWPPGRWPSSFRGRLREHLLVLAGLVGFVGAVYVAVVIVLGVLVGRSDAPQPPAVGGCHGGRRSRVRICAKRAAGVGQPPLGPPAPAAV